MKRGAVGKTKISVTISSSTNALVEHYVKAKGIEKAHLVEEALLHHLNALHELPADITVVPGSPGPRRRGASAEPPVRRGGVATRALPGSAVTRGPR